MGVLITSPEQATPGWLTDILQRTGDLDSGRVSNVRIRLDKTRPYSRIAHLQIEYSVDAPAAAPTKLFLKLANPNEQDGGKEVEFYQIAATATVPQLLVRCYDAAFSSDTCESHLLMADLSESHFQSDPNEPPSRFYSELAVKCLAQFHAFWWEHPMLGNDVGSFFDDAWLETFEGDLNLSITRFLRFAGDDLSITERETYGRMLVSCRTIWGRLTRPAGLTLTHGDTHWWNFLFPKQATVEQAKLFDWQLWHIDLGARDLAFLVALGGFAERRPDLDPFLVRLYHETLIANGVKNYPWSAFWDDYRWSAIRNLNLPVIFWSQGKHESTWRSALERAFQSFNELKCADLI